MKKILLFIFLILALFIVGCNAEQNNSSLEEGIDGFTYRLNGEEYSVVKYKDASVSELTIPTEYNGLAVTEIEDSAFSGFESLKTIQIPNTIKHIGDQAFTMCYSLEEITLPEGVTSIGDEVFKYTTGLKKATLPDSLTTIGKRVFYSSGINEIKLPSNLKEIPEGFFEYCVRLESITLPESVNYIRINAFNNCTSLKEINLDNILMIDNWALSHNYELEIIDLPNVVSIGDNVFRHNRNLKKVYLPKSLSVIGTNAFADLERVVIFSESEADSWDTVWNPHNYPVFWAYQEVVDNGEYEYVITNNNTISILGLSKAAKAVELVIPEKIDGREVVEIVSSAFIRNKELISIHIPSTIKEINKYTFKNAVGLKKVTFEEGSKLEVIGRSAFESTVSLDEIELPKTVKKISASAFASIYELEEIYIPESVEIIEFDAFQHLDSNLTIYAQAEIPPMDWNMSGWIVKEIKWGSE